MKDLRIAALRRFAVAITVLNVLGHLVLGFEPSWAQPLAALLASYATELLLETVAARAGAREPRWRGGPRRIVDFLLAPHITGLACSMLLYANARVWPIVFASVLAIGSKWIFRAPAPGGERHFFNPSNFGIAGTLIIFGWVGIAPPYQFTENVAGAWDLIIPAIVVVTGTLLNARYTRRLPLVAAWLVGFALQALVRAAVFDHPLAASLAPMTGLAFLLFTFYMVTDPATTPSGTAGQAAFGVGVAATYAVLVAVHVVFGLFLALVVVCAIRGLVLHVRARSGVAVADDAARTRRVRAVAPVCAMSPVDAEAGLPRSIASRIE